MTEQHTPEPSFGKWVLGSKAHGDEYALCISVIRPTGRRDFIARALPLDDSDEAEANARLIAAAPETAAERDRLRAARDRLQSLNNELFAERDRLRALNAELVGALELVVLRIRGTGIGGDKYPSLDERTEIWSKVNATLAKAKEA